jgi:hypothetical protein
VTEKSFGWILRLWVVMASGCAALFWVGGLLPAGALQQGGVAVRTDLGGAMTALYFSVVTATSVGYGDVVPVGWARLLAVGEAAAGLLIFGMLVSKLVSRRQEKLTLEIHRITFESRLGRVRTTLHLVLSELQNLARTCADPGAANHRLLARVETAAIMLLGELRAVHDLLYRPQEEPDEELLTGILVEVGEALLELRELLLCIPPALGPRPSLRATVAAIAALSREICAECVPHSYAPGLAARMDDIQRLASELSAP